MISVAAGKAASVTVPRRPQKENLKRGIYFGANSS